MDWVEFELHCAKAFDKPIVVLEPFGSHDTIAPAVLELGDEVVPWDLRQIVDAIKRQARHEEQRAKYRQQAERLATLTLVEPHYAPLSAEGLAAARERMIETGAALLCPAVTVVLSG